MISEEEITRLRKSSISNSIEDSPTRDVRKRGNTSAYNIPSIILISLCCITGARSISGFEKLRAEVNAARQAAFSSYDCDFEGRCEWFWNKAGRFIRTDANATKNRVFGPITDYSGSENGHFLWMVGPASDKIWSKEIPPTGVHCHLNLGMHQVLMNNGTIQMVIETDNHTSSMPPERFGNDDGKWEQTNFNIGYKSLPYKIVLEINAPHDNSTVAIDDIRLVNCFPESTTYYSNNYTNTFCCNNGSCLNKTRVCDLTRDCAEGEDELAECDKIPETARCNFESGWCGWRNVAHQPLVWSLNQGETPSFGTGPSYDHTYRNKTGTYAVVEVPKSAKIADRGTIDSPIFNPTPPYSADEKSPYYKSCQARFSYHQYGADGIHLTLYMVQIKPHQNKTEELWTTHGNFGNVWYNEAVPLPDSRYQYYLQFEAARGYTGSADVAIDDFSLSPECFGIQVPSDVVKDFNYYSPVIGVGIPEQHADFVNETVVKLTTCGAIGRLGPTAEQCSREYNKSDHNRLNPKSLMSISPPVMVDPSLLKNMTGIQRWTAPKRAYYTLIGIGARGGRGSGGMGSTLGALVRGVIELHENETLYFLIGQPGRDACPQTLGRQSNNCQKSNQTNSPSGYAELHSRLLEVNNITWRDGGGGGGGATYIFTVNSLGEFEPILIASGGGGLGQGKFNSDGGQHGKGPVLGRQIMRVNSTKKNPGGDGGGWEKMENYVPGRGHPGTSFMKGAQGGRGCSEHKQGQGDGGFGGGGGGCQTGGGGGGYIGGRIGEFGNGEGGYSFVSPRLLFTNFSSGIDRGPGEALIISAISGCGCEFRCVALDIHLSETTCLCPPDWQLGQDLRSCIVVDETNVGHQTFMILLIVGCLSILLVVSALCFVLYNRYQNWKVMPRQRPVMFSRYPETVPSDISERWLTEFNPNYEFAGKLYSIKDLPHIQRDSISFVKPLGQGAFGEVFQGIHKDARGNEFPVAVKTLPSISTPQAVGDFMMEALIMSKFNHPNIVQFIGISFDKHPRYIILELLAGGDLKNFLREERPRPEMPTGLTMYDLVICAHDVAKGCKYMESERFIHRDIAARNCLLTCKGPGRVVKIADFGMARDIYRSDYYRKGGKAMLPVKWMPPESFLDGIFTTKTDVWAFGVLLWEIMSFGYMPYTGCANREVISMVSSGGRLKKPAGCPDPIYGLMKRCWDPSPEKRPSFATILERIGYCLKDPDVINHSMPNYDILPPCEREIPIMRPDPETECINVLPDPDNGGYMQPRPVLCTSRYNKGLVLTIPYADLMHCDDTDNIQETAFIEPKQHDGKSENVFKNLESIDNSTNRQTEEMNNEEITARDDNAILKVPDEFKDSEGNVDSINLNSHDSLLDRRNMSNGNGDNTTTTETNSDSLTTQESTRSHPDAVVSSPNTRTSSPNHTVMHSNANNINGMKRKSALKAALSLDPTTLYRGTIPYEKIAFSTPPARFSNPGSVELRKDSIGHDFSRAEECSC